MITNLLFDFIVDNENKSIRVKREFAAGLPLVWDAWTKAELLDQWWAPEPWKAKTKMMDFREGGYWLYAMIGPDKEEIWSKCEFDLIDKQKSYTSHDGFCDADGNIDPDMPLINWANYFVAQPDSTLVDINLSFDSMEDLEKIIEMGFREGFTSGLSNLDELLKKLENK